MMRLQITAIQPTNFEDRHTIDLGWGSLTNVPYDTLVSRSKLERLSVEQLGRTFPWYTPAAWYDLIDDALKEYHQRNV